MKKNLILLAFLVFVAVGSFAQQSLWGTSETSSPKSNSDNTVSFQLVAPKATEVKLLGSWMPDNARSVSMTKDEAGAWNFTTEVLPADLYLYHFEIDGLRCNDPENVYFVRDVASVFNIFIVGGGKADLYKVSDVPHGTVASRWYDSPTNKNTRRISIYTPAGYEKSKQKYPVLYLLHGMGGDEGAWLDLGRTAQIMDNLIAQGKAKPMIVVMTNGNMAQTAAPGESSLGFYKPSFRLPKTMDGSMEESFGDVIKFVETNYRAIAKKDARAIAGLSMGGFHSLHISRFHANTFDYVGLFSPAINPRGDATSLVYKDIDKTLEVQKKNGYKLYWIAIGKTDFLYKEVEEYKAKLDKMGITYKYKESEGGHTWTNWRDYLSEFVPMLFR